MYVCHHHRCVDHRRLCGAGEIQCLSDFSTLIEVFSDNRPGLLYLITHALSTLRLDVRIAKIATKGDQIADVFYARDLGGQKVEDKDQIEEIRQVLFHHIAVQQKSKNGFW